MNTDLIDRIAHAVLYEGYVLYPYRASLKNRQRWTFGGLLPRAYSADHPDSGAATMQTQCLVAGTLDTTLHIRVRFLHLLVRTVGELVDPLAVWPREGEPEFRPVESLAVGDERVHSWQEAEEREVIVDQLCMRELVMNSARREFAFPGRRQLEPVIEPSGTIVGVQIREQQPLSGSIVIAAERLTDDLLRVTVTVANESPLQDAVETNREAALLQALVSTHTLLEAGAGEFVSLIDPPEVWAAHAAACRNIGTWPVLVGEPGDKHGLLSAPIILYDYPQVAQESPGDLFDGTEIDEILTLRILTLTDAEKREALELDEHTRSLLARTEALACEQLQGLHGTIRDAGPAGGA